jgi:hypothetical protein
MSAEAISSRIALLAEIDKTLSEESARLDKVRTMKSIVKELYKRLKSEEVFHLLRAMQGRSNSAETGSPFRCSISPFELAESSASIDLDKYSSGQEGENVFDDGANGLFWMDMTEVVSNGSLRTASE